MQNTRPAFAGCGRLPSLVLVALSVRRLPARAKLRQNIVAHQHLHHQSFTSDPDCRERRPSTQASRFHQSSAESQRDPIAVPLQSRCVPLQSHCIPIVFPS